MADGSLEQLPPLGGWCWGDVSQVTGRCVAGQAGNCRRSVPKVSQVCKKRQTCDAILLPGPICVAGDAKNADLRRFAAGPATLRDATCNGLPPDLRRSGMPRAAICGLTGDGV